MKRRDAQPRPDQASGEHGALVSIEGYSDFSRIGSGGFSVVYQAHEVALNRNVAVKVLNAGLAGDDERRAFERECRALGQLDHPDIVRVYRSAYTVDDRPCIIMELYDGNFREVLDRSGALGALELLDVGVRMAVALHVAHSKGVLHRDVKPHNIFRSRYGDPALGDFGISTLVGERTHSGPGGLSVAYAAPEVLEESGVSPATDVYALAATLYHLAAGRAPFASSDLRQAVRKILDEPPPPLERADLPPGFERVLRAALAKRPGDRPASALAFAESLREVQARAGHLQTPIKLERAPGDAPRPPAAGAPAPSPSRTPTPAPPASARGDSAGPAADLASGATIARRQPPPPAPAPAPPTTSVRRRLIAVGALVVAVIAVVIGILVSAGDDGAPAESAVSTTVPPVDSFLAVVPVPSGVTITATSGGYEVAIPPVTGASSFIVTPVGGTAESLTVAAADLPLVLSGESATGCVTVQAVGSGGRVSRQAGPFCAQTAATG